MSHTPIAFGMQTQLARRSRQAGAARMRQDPVRPKLFPIMTSSGDTSQRKYGSVFTTHNQPYTCPTQREQDTCSTV